MKTLLDNIKPLSVPSGAHKKTSICILFYRLKNLFPSIISFYSCNKLGMIFTYKSRLYQRFCLSRLQSEVSKVSNLEGCQRGHQSLHRSLENQCQRRLPWQSNFTCNSRYYYAQGMFMVGLSNLLHLRSWILHSFILIFSLFLSSQFLFFFLYCLSFMFLTTLRASENVHRGSGKEAQLHRYYWLRGSLRRATSLNQKAVWGRIYTERPNPINQLPANQSATSAWESSEMTAIAAIGLIDRLC